MEEKNSKKWIYIGLAVLSIIVAIGAISVVVLMVDSKERAYRSKIDEIMADDIEVERKWLIDPENIPYDLSEAEVCTIEQTYICFEPEFRIRKVNGGEYYTCTFKANLSSDGLVRDEIDTGLTEEEYLNLLSKGEGNTIYKTRYQFLDEDGQLIAIDIFEGDLKGLAYMEIEFPSIEEGADYGTPDWVIKDVTNDVRYKNGHLARYGIPE